MINELTEYLTQIADRTDSGDISWSQINPTTYKWDQGSANAAFYVTIQKAPTITNFRALLNASPDAVSETTYLFQVQKEDADSIVLSLSSKERPEYRAILSRIFNGAKNSMDKEALKALKELLQK